MAGHVDQEALERLRYLGRLFLAGVVALSGVACGFEELFGYDGLVHARVFLPGELADAQVEPVGDNLLDVGEVEVGEVRVFLAAEGLDVLEVVPVFAHAEHGSDRFRPFLVDNDGLLALLDSDVLVSERGFGETPAFLGARHHLVLGVFRAVFVVELGEREFEAQHELVGRFVERVGAGGSDELADFAFVEEAQKEHSVHVVAREALGFVEEQAVYAAFLNHGDHFVEHGASTLGFGAGALYELFNDREAEPLGGVPTVLELVLQ